MGFYPTTGSGTDRKLGGKGKRDSRLIFVGDFTSRFDLNAGRALSGMSYSTFEVLMHQAGILTTDVYFTNLFKSYVQVKDKMWSKTKGRITKDGESSAAELVEELDGLSGKIIVTFGEAPFSVLTGQRKLEKRRGYFYDCPLLPDRHVIGTYHPAELLRARTHLRPILMADLKKASLQSKKPIFERPERTLVYVHDTLSDAMEWLDYYFRQDVVGFDIEVTNLEVSCISFSSSPDIACVIPIAGRWKVDEEAQVWRGIQQVLGNPKSIKVVQNGMFDIPFLASHNGIIVRGPIHDTMVAHSIMYPDLLKSLGFLGSLYCGTQQYWKDMANFKSVKKED